MKMWERWYGRFGEVRGCDGVGLSVYVDGVEVGKEDLDG